MERRRHPEGLKSGRLAERLDPGHFYAAYIYDEPALRDHDVTGLMDEARRLGYPVRYWWLSDAMNLQGAPDRLIVCVHHPSGDENAGLDLSEALHKNQVKYDELDKAAVEEYAVYGKPIRWPGDIQTPAAKRLFPNLPTSRADDDLEHPSLRETDPLVALTVGDAQSIALEALGRELTDEEIAGITTQIQEYLDHKITPLIAGLEPQKAAHSIRGDERLEQSVEAGEIALLSDFLVYYSLGGMTLVRAAEGREASNIVFGVLHALIGKSEHEGVTASEAKQVRLHEMEVDIENVEALEFPLDESSPH